MRPTPSVMVHATPDMEMIRRDLEKRDLDVRHAHELLHEAFLPLLRRVRACEGDKRDVAILALRGGLLAYRAASLVFGGPLGLLAPRRRAGGHVTAYGDVPTSSRYTVVDTIANTGYTLRHCLVSLREHRPKARIRVVFLFGTAAACKVILDAFPGITIHAGWTDYERGRDGRLVGIRYDAGDYAMMDEAGRRISW